MSTSILGPKIGQISTQAAELNAEIAPNSGLADYNRNVDLKDTSKLDTIHDEADAMQYSSIIKLCQSLPDSYSNQPIKFRYLSLHPLT